MADCLATDELQLDNGLNGCHYMIVGDWLMIESIKIYSFDIFQEL